MNGNGSGKYMNPYLAGLGLGFFLLAAYVLMGRGLGASGAFASTVSYLVQAIAPAHIGENGFYLKYLDPDRAPHPLLDWLVIEVIGIMIGGILSGWLASRVRLSVDKGPRISRRMRLIWAFAGGMIMAAGAQLARGCTSGQALSGGALLNLGSWAFMICVFAGGYALAYLVRRQWR